MINCHKCQVLIADGWWARRYSASSLFHTRIRMRIPSLLFVHLGRQNGVQIRTTASKEMNFIPSHFFFFSFFFCSMLSHCPYWMSFFRVLLSPSINKKRKWINRENSDRSIPFFCNVLYRWMNDLFPFLTQKKLF